MKKSWIIILICFVAIIGIIIAVVMQNEKQNKISIIANEINEVSEKITDECTDEYQMLEQQAKLEVNSKEEKISPNCLLILKRYHKNCNHTINEYLDIPQDLVNLTQQDLQKEYPNWEIQKYSSTQIVLYKEFESDCGQHFILRNNDGKIAIYKLNENNEEELYENTEISIEYLTETDKVEIQNGIKVNGIEELNQIIEDFE